MSTLTAKPQIYHITHIKNLPTVLGNGGLWSDANMVERGGPAATIGMNKIKERRLGLPVDCHPGTHVGDFVPFYFCPRSVMLYLIHRGHPELRYSDGQAPILHLEADLHSVIGWAESARERWAFSLSNAGAYSAVFRKRRDQLVEINWAAVAALDWSTVKEAKQAEFLVHNFFPWHLVQRIGVISTTIGAQVSNALADAKDRPVVNVLPNWYY